MSDFIDASARKITDRKIGTESEGKWSQRLFELKTKADRSRQNIQVGLGNKLELSRRWLRRHLIVAYVIMGVFAWYTSGIITSLIAAPIVAALAAYVAVQTLFILVWIGGLVYLYYLLGKAFGKWLSK